MGKLSPLAVLWLLRRRGAVFVAFVDEGHGIPEAARDFWAVPKIFNELAKLRGG
ncbi:MAG TPA: hypothetical protein VK090_03975 [Paracoccaceae bacterium]|nr:hypothetical protein [Paracoccaceae bacterium]